MVHDDVDGVFGVLYWEEEYDYYYYCLLEFVYMDS